MTAALIEQSMGNRRISTWISDEAWADFMEMAEQDGITMSDRVRALVDLWQHDADVRAAVDEKARVLAAEHRRKRYRKTGTSE